MLHPRNCRFIKKNFSKIFFCPIIYFFTITVFNDWQLLTFQHEIKLEMNYDEMLQPDLPNHNNYKEPHLYQHQEGLLVRQKKAQFASLNSKNLFCMIIVIVVFGIVVTSLFRTGQNHINPVTFIVHFLSFILTPLIIIGQNQNLKSFTLTATGNFLCDYLSICSFFNTHNKIHPIII